MGNAIAAYMEQSMRRGIGQMARTRQTVSGRNGKQVCIVTAKDELDASYEAGKQVCRDGETRESNPFDFVGEGDKWSDWLTGFNAVFSRLSR